MLHKLLNFKKHLDVTGTFERDIYSSLGGEYSYRLLIYVTYKKMPIGKFSIRCHKLVYMIKSDLRNQLNKIELENRQPDFWIMLGCLPTKDVKKIEASYRKMCMVYHPDHGGNTDIFNMLTKSKEKALEFANK